MGVTDVVDVTVTLRNRGEDSYGTTVQLHHAAALSYRKAVVLQVTPPEPSSAWKTPQKSPRPSRSAFGLLKLFPTRSRLPTRPRGRPTPLGTSLRFPTSPRGLPTPLQTSSRPPEVYLASPTPPQPSSRSSVGSRGLRNLLRVLSIPKPRNETSHIPACPPQALQRCRWPPKPFRMSSKAPRSPSGLPTSPDPPPRVVSPPPPRHPLGGTFSVLQEIRVPALQLGAGGGAAAQNRLPRQPPHLPPRRRGSGGPRASPRPNPLGDGPP